MEWQAECQESNIRSPPKPTRLIVIDSSNFFPTRIKRKDCKELANEGGNESSSSLPALAGEVADAQKQQVMELCKRRDVLDQLKEDYVKEQDKIELVKEEISSMSRRVYLVEDEVAIKKLKCHELEIDLEHLMTSGRQLAIHIETERKNLQNEKRKYEQYVAKMTKYRDMVENYESSSNARKQISVLEMRNGQRRHEVHCLEDGNDDTCIGIMEEYKILQAENSHLGQRNKDLEYQIEQSKLEIKSEKERQAQLKRETQLLNKRNHAQLTRLKRQLQEAMGRSRHWTEEACKLERSIARIRGKLEE